MKNLLSIYKYFFFITIVISLLFAFNVFSVWKVNPSDSKDFSAVRVSEDIYEISKEHHSIEHPVERAKVKNYLFSRLNQMGGDPQLFNYDSIDRKSVV